MPVPHSGIIDAFFQVPFGITCLSLRAFSHCPSPANSGSPWSLGLVLGAHAYRPCLNSATRVDRGIAGLGLGGTPVIPSAIQYNTLARLLCPWNSWACPTKQPTDNSRHSHLSASLAHASLLFSWVSVHTCWADMHFDTFRHL